MRTRASLGMRTPSPTDAGLDRVVVSGVDTCSRERDRDFTAHPDEAPGSPDDESGVVPGFGVPSDLARFDAGVHAVGIRTLAHVNDEDHWSAVQARDRDPRHPGPPRPDEECRCASVFGSGAGLDGQRSAWFDRHAHTASARFREREHVWHAQTQFCPSVKQAFETDGFETWAMTAGEQRMTADNHRRGAGVTTRRRLRRGSPRDEHG
jgi:hypothetical protein